MNRELAGSGISSGTAPLLLEIRDGKDHNPFAIAAAIGVDKAYVTRAIQSLKRAGQVAIVPVTANRRSVSLSLTEKGRAVTGQVENAMRAWVTIVSRGVSQEDLDTVSTMFEQFYANPREYSTGRSR